MDLLDVFDLLKTSSSKLCAINVTCIGILPRYRPEPYVLYQVLLKKYIYIYIKRQTLPEIYQIGDQKKCKEWGMHKERVR